MNRVELNLLDKEKTYAGGWTESTTDLLEKWLQKCQIEAELHTMAAKRKLCKHRAMTIPTVIAGTMASAMSFYNTGGGCDADASDESGANPLNIMVSVLTASAAILSSVNTMYSFAQGKQKHVNTAAQYVQLAQLIQVQLYLPITRKSDVEVLLTSVTDQFTNITTSAPLM